MSAKSLSLNVDLILQHQKDLQAQITGFQDQVELLFATRNAESSEQELQRFYEDVRYLQEEQNPEQRERRKRELTDHILSRDHGALRHLNIIHNALMGSPSSGSVLGDLPHDKGLLRRQFESCMAKFEHDTGWTIPLCAKSLDGYLARVWNFQYMYFSLWIAAANAKGHSTGPETSVFHDKLIAQEKVLADLRPKSIKVYTSCSDFCERFYEMRPLGSDLRLAVTLVKAQQQTMRGDAVTTVWNDYAFLPYPEAKGQGRLRIVFKLDAPRSSMLLTLPNSSGQSTGTAVQSERIYHGTGFCMLKTEGKERWAKFVTEPRFWERPGRPRAQMSCGDFEPVRSKETAATYQVVPAGGGRDEIVVRLRHTGEGRRWFSVKDPSSGKFVATFRLIECGPDNVPEEESCVLM